MHIVRDVTIIIYDGDAFAVAPHHATSAVRT